MNRLPLFLLTIMPSVFAHAQFYLVSDNDGYVNVRNKADNKSKIVDTLGNGHLVYLLEEKSGDWIQINFNHHGHEWQGYVYHDRLIPISSYDSIPLLRHDENTAFCSSDSIRVVVTRQKFDKTKYRFTYAEGNQVATINGKPYWGDDGEMPRQEYKSIAVSIGNRKILLPHSAICDLFEPTIWHTEVHYDRKNDILYIQSGNSDGAGYYDIIWRVVKGVYTGRDVESGD